MKIGIYAFIIIAFITTISVLKTHGGNSSVNIYSISDTDMLDRYSNGRAGEEELKDYFNRTTNKLLLSLSSVDIKTITISKEPNSFNTDAEIFLGPSGKKKIEVLNKSYLNKLVIVTFNSNFIGSFVVLDKINDVLTLTSNSIGLEENLKVLRDLSSQNKANSVSDLVVPRQQRSSEWNNLNLQTGFSFYPLFPRPRSHTGRINTARSPLPGRFSSVISPP